MPERLIPFGAVFNFRDLGGYPTASGREIPWRRLFRADGLHRIQPDEIEIFRALGIATVLDLRSAEEEVVERGRVPVDDLEYRNLPLFDVEPEWPPDDRTTPDDSTTPDDRATPDDRTSNYLADRYIEILEAAHAPVAEALAVIADPNAHPLVFHCAAGKDRTGILAALVLGILGVPDQLIADDYALSAEAMVRLDEWAAVAMPDNPSRLSMYPEPVLGATAETMLAFLDHLRSRYGGPAALCARLGVDPSALTATILV